MTVVRAIFSCFGLFVCAWLLFGLFVSGAAFFGGRALEAAAGHAAEREQKRDDEREERLAEYRREVEQRRQGTRIDSRSGQPMQRARPMTDVSR